MPALVRIGGPLSKLLRDVGERGYAGGGDRNLVPLGEDPIRDGQLVPRGAGGNRQRTGIALKVGDPLHRASFVAVSSRLREAAT